METSYGHNQTGMKETTASLWQFCKLCGSLWATHKSNTNVHVQLGFSLDLLIRNVSYKVAVVTVFEKQ